MGVSSSPFWIFSDLLALTPLILLMRAIFPQAGVFRATLALVGAYSLFLVGPRFVLLFIAYWFAVWLLQKAVVAIPGVRSPALQKAATAAILIAALAPMAVWKLFPKGFELESNRFFSKLLWQLFPSAGPSDAMFAFLLPLGLSFAVFRALDLLIKVRLELLEPIGLGRTFYYGFFPSILALGPISEYEEVRADQRRERFPAPGDIGVGLFRVGIGGVKIFLLSYYLEVASNALWHSGATPWWKVWLAMGAFALHFYLNFSGYSDLAIGLARLWGLKLKENFNNPYLKTNPQAFWASWHMSLTRWAQRYVFVPLGGMRKNRQYFAIFATIMVIALWHGLEWPLVIFGVYHASIATGHRWLDEHQRRKGVAKRAGPLIDGLKRLAVFSYVAFSIPMFYLTTAEVPVFYRSLLPF